MASSLIKTPHPVTLEGQEKILVHLLPGESLYSLLHRALGEQLNGELWNVSVDGVEVPREAWYNYYPKDNQVIECVGDVGRAALAIVAVVALTIFTGGAFAAVAAGGSFAGLGAAASYAAIAGIQIAGTLLINKVLAPKPPGSPDSTTGPQSYSLANSSNQARQYGAVPILFGRIQVAPDLLSNTYNYFDADDMYLAMHLSWGIGVGRIQDLRNGDTLLASYDNNVQQYNAGFSQMPQQTVPLFGDTESQAGGALQQEKVLLDVVRTTAKETVRVILNISGTLYDVSGKGKLRENQEIIDVYYRPIGSSGWRPIASRILRNSDRRTLRFGITWDAPAAGQYDIYAKRRGVQATGKDAQIALAVDSVVSVVRDNSTYDGIARTGLTLRANERLAGTPGQINALAIAAPIPEWDGSSWVNVESSNPGAQMLKYLRGYYSPTGRLIAGVGLADDEIDIEAFKAFMVFCRQQGFGYNYWLTQERDHLTVLNSIAGAAMAQFTDANGRYSVVWVAEDQAVDGTINMARIKRGSFRIDYSLIATADGVVARYWDSAANKEALLRVPMPGVTTMLQPATLTFEGVTSEAQAAFLARYYLAQSLYQYKDIGFGTSLENLTFRRLSLLQMQHDMTQWGYGGVVVSAEAVSNRIRFTLDESVPPPPPGRQGYIGIRVPGQRAATVLRVQPFSTKQNTITLDEPWPADLPLPGDSTGNPAHDTIWIYDFKETPGLTVRVTNIARAADRSASVSVVQESAEFWTYVRTGVYEPADSGSLLRTRPVASALHVAEQQRVIGDVAQDQLVVSFEVTGPYDKARIYTTVPNGDLRLRTETTTRSAAFDIEGPGVYTVTVIPYNAQGLRGTAVSVVFATKDAGQPPVLVDYFEVTSVGGGVRFYNWGFNPDTIQSADFVGVELRYMPGEDVALWNWDAMTPIGETGYHTVPFEAVVPTSGKYIFACRARNANGTLSAGAKVIYRELGANLGQVIDGMNDQNEQSFEDINAEIRQVQDGLVREAVDREAAVRKEIDDRVAAVQLLEADIAANAQSLLNEQLAREAAITEEQAIRQSTDESLALQISQVSAGTGDQFDSARIWYFDTSPEGWSGTAADGFLNPGATTTSPALNITGTQYRYFKARVKRVGTPVWAGEVAWTATGGTAGDKPLPQPIWDASGIGTTDLHDIPWDGQVTGVTVTLGKVDATNYYLVDWIAIGRPTPGASVAMVRDETQARITQDGVLAQRTETLAVQLRGNYTGTDAAQLTTGLLHSESLLRIDGDGALGQRIDSMQVAVDGNAASLTQESTVRAQQDKVLADRIVVLRSDLSGKADSSAVQDLSTRVTETENGLESVSSSVLRLDAQLYGPHAGDTEENAGDTTVYAGTLTTYSAIASADQALSQRIESVTAQFGEFSGVVRNQVSVLANAQSVQATSIQQLTVSLADKAEASAVNTLTTRVESIDGRTTVNAQNIQSVSAAVGQKANASVVQEMSVNISNVVGQVAQVNARYFLGVSANGLIGGMYIGNNGQLVNVRFQADRFTIESPTGSGERFEYSNNNIRIYDTNGTMRVRLGVWS
jgi:hypothetical protein